VIRAWSSSSVAATKPTGRRVPASTIGRPSARRIITPVTDPDGGPVRTPAPGWAPDAVGLPTIAPPKHVMPAVVMGEARERIDPS